MKYSAEIREKAKELREGGMSYSKIAAQLGVGSPGTIANWLDLAIYENGRQYARDNRDRINARNADPACKEAARERASLWYYNNIEKATETREKYRVAHAEEMKEYLLEYNAAHKAETRLYGVAYREENKERIRELKALYYTRNRETIIEKTVELSRIRRDRVHTSEGIRKDQYEEIWAEQEGMCFYCGERMLRDGDWFNDRYYNVEHLNPIANGGFHAQSNVLYACRKCNGSKSDTLVEDWMPSIMDKIYSHPRLEYDIEENNKRWLI